MHAQRGGFVCMRVAPEFRPKQGVTSWESQGIQYQSHASRKCHSTTLGRVPDVGIPSQQANKPCYMNSLSTSADEAHAGTASLDETEFLLVRECVCVCVCVRVCVCVGVCRYVSRRDHIICVMLLQALANVTCCITTRSPCHVSSHMSTQVPIHHSRDRCRYEHVCS